MRATIKCPAFNDGVEVELAQFTMVLKSAENADKAAKVFAVGECRVVHREQDEENHFVTFADFAPIKKP